MLVCLMNEFLSQLFSHLKQSKLESSKSLLFYVGIFIYKVDPWYNLSANHNKKKRKKYNYNSKSWISHFFFVYYWLRFAYKNFTIFYHKMRTFMHTITFICETSDTFTLHLFKSWFAFTLLSKTIYFNILYILTYQTLVLIYTLKNINNKNMKLMGGVLIIIIIITILCNIWGIWSNLLWYYYYPDNLFSNYRGVSFIYLVPFSNQYISHKFLNRFYT